MRRSYACPVSGAKHVRVANSDSRAAFVLLRLGPHFRTRKRSLTIVPAPHTSFPLRCGLLAVVRPRHAVVLPFSPSGSPSSASSTTWASRPCHPPSRPPAHRRTRRPSLTSARPGTWTNPSRCRCHEPSIPSGPRSGRIEGSVARLVGPPHARVRSTGGDVNPGPHPQRSGTPGGAAVDGRSRTRAAR